MSSMLYFLRVVLTTQLIHHTVGGREGVKLVRCYSVINFDLIRKYPNSGDQSDINLKINGE
jgi:hypothetical protein